MNEISTHSYLPSCTDSSVAGCKPLLHGFSVTPSQTRPSFLQRAKSEEELGVCRAGALCSTCSPISLWPWTNGKKTCAKDHLRRKNKSCKKDFAEWGNGVQLSCVLVTDAFSPAYSLKLHVHLNPPVACGYANGDITAFVSSLLSSCKYKKNNYCNAFQ